MNIVEGSSEGTGTFASRIALLSLLLLALHGAAAGSAQAQAASDYEKMVAGVCNVLYKVAWPTATYEGAQFRGIQPTESGANVVFRLYGRSGLDDSSLWTDLIVTFQGLEPVDIRFGQNNAVLFAPGETSGAVLDVIKSELRKRQQPRGNAFTFTNACDRPLRLAVHYLALDGQWHTAGWWNVGAGERTGLNTAEGQPITTQATSWYFYAQATDGSDIEWRGEYAIDADGQTLPMLQASDTTGPREWTATCN